jgi:hypothetical protein
MKILTRVADRMVSRLVPQKSADACIPPDCFTQRCCFNCAGRLICN